MNAEILELVPSEKREAAQAYLQTREARPPKIIQAMLLFGALISSVAVLFGSTVLFGWIVPDLLIGVVFIAVGWYLVHKNENRPDWGYVFCAQLGWVFGVIGRLELIDWLNALGGYHAGKELLVVGGVAALSYPFFKNQLDRVFFCTWALAAVINYVSGGVLRAVPRMEMLDAVLCVLYFGGALWIFAARRMNLRPLAYAGVLVGAFGVTMLLGPWEKNIALVLFAGLAAFCASRLPVPFKTRALVCALIIALACWLNVDAFMGLFACAAGYYWRERILEWLGLAGFAAGLVWMYYDMHATLLTKSGWLMLAGACVLAAYAWVRRNDAR